MGLEKALDLGALFGVHSDHRIRQQPFAEHEVLHLAGAEKVGDGRGQVRAIGPHVVALHHLERTAQAGRNDLPRPAAQTPPNPGCGDDGTLHRQLQSRGVHGAHSPISNGLGTGKYAARN